MVCYTESLLDMDKIDHQAREQVKY